MGEIAYERFDPLMPVDIQYPPPAAEATAI